MASIATETKGMSRREFLYYIWGASVALLMAEAAGLFTWFLLPRFREGEFGGAFMVDAKNVPEINSPPVNYPDGRFWLVNLSTEPAQQNEAMYQVDDEGPIEGVAAIYKVCTHLGCIYDWSPARQQFECPCHGSKYRLDGRRMNGPAPRALDRFSVSALDETGNELATSPVGPDGEYLPLNLPAGTAVLRVNTGERNRGTKEPFLCDAHGYC